jgi:chromosome segregation ATPase
MDITRIEFLHESIKKLKDELITFLDQNNDDKQMLYNLKIKREKTLKKIINLVDEGDILKLQINNQQDTDSLEIMDQILKNLLLEKEMFQAEVNCLDAKIELLSVKESNLNEIIKNQKIKIKHVEDQINKIKNIIHNLVEDIQNMK